jgi:heme/copper-type cytochrome/quinol oxidase subunit 2
MSKAGRFGLIALAVVVAIVAFVVAKPGDEDEKVEETPAAQTADSPTATSPSAKEPPADGPDAIEVQAIDLQDHQVSGGPVEIKATKGQTVRFLVRSDKADDIHVHGYDIERKVAPGRATHFSFKADIEGIFEVESHEAEHHGHEPVIARLVVQPS